MSYAMLLQLADKLSLIHIRLKVNESYLVIIWKIKFAFENHELYLSYVTGIELLDYGNSFYSGIHFHWIDLRDWGFHFRSCRWKCRWCH